VPIEQVAMWTADLARCARFHVSYCPRRMGSVHHEGVIIDPDGNRMEIRS